MGSRINAISVTPVRLESSARSEENSPTRSAHHTTNKIRERKLERFPIMPIVLYSPQLNKRVDEEPEVEKEGC